MVNWFHRVIMKNERAQNLYNELVPLIDFDLKKKIQNCY